MSRKKQTVKNIVFVLIALLLAGALAALPFWMENAQSDESAVRILSAEAESGSISTILSGAGTLTEEEAAAVTIPAGVTLEGYYVSNGDTVTEGQPLAKVDRTSVMQAISSVQETLDYLAEQLEDAAESSETQTLTAASDARVMAVYAAGGEAVQDAMLEHGCLAVLSLDGYLSVTFSTEEMLEAGDAVTVALSDGTEVSGRVESMRLGSAVILISDEKGTPGTQAAVRAEDGTLLGTGEVKIHSEARVTAYTGTVDTVYITEGKKVSSGAKLFRLSEAADNSAYTLLAETHREYEEIMLELFLLYQDGVVTAPCDGCVSGIDSDAVLLRGSGAYTAELLSDPENPDAYFNRFGTVLSVSQTVQESGAGQAGESGGQTAELPSGGTFPGSGSGAVEITVLMADEEINPISDYSEIVSMDTEGVSYENGETRTFSVTEVYCWDGSSWQQKSAAETVTEGSTWLFVYGKNLIWVIGTEQVEPAESSADTGSTERNGGSSMGSWSLPSGSTASGSGAVQSFTLYSEEEQTILSVTPQDTVTVTITVDELDILSVAVGQEAEVTIDALPGRSFSGTVTAVSTEGTNSGGSTKFTAEITLERTESMLAGMNASTGIVLAETEAVLTLPAAALQEETGRTVVYTSYDEESETFGGAVEVETGVSDGTTVEILSGLSEGDTVWYSTYDSTLN